jgi:hypothetical protein
MLLFSFFYKIVCDDNIFHFLEKRFREIFLLQYMKPIVTKLSPKIAKNYCCPDCDYNTTKISDYKKHLLTIKHKNRDFETNANELKQKVAENLSCICGSSFNNRTSLWRHKKKCAINNNKTEEIISPNEMSDKDLIIMLVKQNSQLMKHNTELVDIIKNTNGTQNSNNINNSMNNNKTFNLQFFLNETCKDAINITDFVNNMKIELGDLENTGRTGYVEGITSIVLKNLNKLEKHMRPLHCSDLKREILYIKENNEWTKESENKPILTKAIKTIANENIKQINKWKDNYPDCTNAESTKNNLYLKIVSNSMNGLTQEESEKNINKIITNVAKKVTIEK